MIYYIDNMLGSDENSGTVESAPKRSYQDIDIKPGDKVLFKCGNLYKGKLETVSGTSKEPVTYGCYGTGNKPVFSASIDIGDPSKWVELQKNIWQCVMDFPTETCNIVFDEGERPATLCFEKEKVCKQGFFHDTFFGKNQKLQNSSGLQAQQLILYSVQNPGEYYHDIQWVGRNRNLAELNPNVIFENLVFQYNGIHAISGTGKNNIIRNCIFRFIGGAIWRLKDSIRFGNAIESWEDAENIEVTHCFFDNIYDSCVTHQGSEFCTNAVNINIHDNLFQNYGMAAYEVRDKMPVRSCFRDNICINAGEGFSENGVNMPRSSEIWPEPMGHHVFLWRIDDCNETDSLAITNNIFYNAKYGAAIYARISEAAQKRLELDRNIYYTENEGMLNYFYNDNYTSFKDYIALSGHDASSELKQVDILSIVQRWKAKNGLREEDVNASEV